MEEASGTVSTAVIIEPIPFQNSEYRLNTVNRIQYSVLYLYSVLDKKKSLPIEGGWQTLSRT
jgi:hypothetical protein